MKLVKNLSPFILLLIIGVITFRFLFFISYIKVQKSDFRKQLIAETNAKVFEVQFSSSDAFINKNGFEWKEKNKELVINGVYHEVISIKKFKDYILVSVIEDKTENNLFKKFFSANTGIHKDFTDLIKLLLNLNYLNGFSDFKIVTLVANLQLNPTESLINESDFYLKLIKPPQA